MRRADFLCLDICLDLVQLKAADGAALYTNAAACTFIIADNRKIIHNGNRFGGAVFLTFHAAYAAVFTLFANNGALFMVGTGNNCLSSFRNKRDKAVGALFYTEATGDTCPWVNVRETVFNADSVSGADLCTVAAAKAAGTAGALAAEEHFCAGAGADSVILGLFTVVETVAAAMYKSDHGFNLFGFYADYSGHFFGDFFAAGAAKIGGGGTIGNSFGVSVTAGKAACAAVSPGKAVTDSGFFLVDLYAHDGGSKNEKKRSHKANAGHNKGGV